VLVHCHLKEGEVTMDRQAHVLRPPSEPTVLNILRFSSSTPGIGAQARTPSRGYSESEGITSRMERAQGEVVRLNGHAP